MAKLIVMHASYGCETGCCGHVIQLADTGQQQGGFDFGHPYVTDQRLAATAAREYAEDLIRSELGEEHVADLDWENSEVHDW